MTLIGSNKLTASTADLTQNIPAPVQMGWHLYRY